MTKTEQNRMLKPKELGKEEFSARRKKALSSCVPIFPPPPLPLPPSLAFRENVAIKIVRNDSIYIQIKKAEDIRWQNPPQTARLRTATILLHYIHIYFGIIFRSILNLLENSLAKKNLPFIHLPIHIPAKKCSTLYFIAG